MDYKIGDALVYEGETFMVVGANELGIILEHSNFTYSLPKPEPAPKINSPILDMNHN